MPAGASYVFTTSQLCNIANCYLRLLYGASARDAAIARVKAYLIRDHFICLVVQEKMVTPVDAQSLSCVLPCVMEMPDTTGRAASLRWDVRVALPHLACACKACKCLEGAETQANAEDCRERGQQLCPCMTL